MAYILQGMFVMRHAFCFDVAQPSIVLQYHQYMAGVGALDKMFSSYRPIISPNAKCQKVH
ncbi:hypothetical protein T06_10724 [Trichinella sp. T6]|nr:hypothetical protein T06_10724 [Trichinella sp. T6]